MATKWNFQTQFPTDSNFVNRIIEAKFSESKSSGNPMITVTSEVVQPAEVEIAGEMVNIAGVKTYNYYTTQYFKDGVLDAEKTKAAFERVFVSSNPDKPSLYEMLGLDGAAENPENPNVKQLVGKMLLTMMSPDVEERRKNPTSEQIAKKQQGDVMKNPVTGKPMVAYRPMIKEIFGQAPVGGAGY